MLTDVDCKNAICSPVQGVTAWPMRAGFTLKSAPPGQGDGFGSTEKTAKKDAWLWAVIRL